MIPKGDELAVLLSPAAASLRVMLGLLLLRAGYEKVRARDGLPDLVAGYRLLPQSLSAPAGLLLIAVEIVLGLLMLSGLYPIWAGFAAALLFALFSLAMGINLARGRRGIACGCLPHSGSGGLSWEKLLLTASLMPLAVVAACPSPDEAWSLRLQEALAGVLLFGLHDALVRLGLSRRASAAS